MKITFIAHSGVFIEFEKCCILIDYYRGEVPSIPEGKKLFVMASHGHGDHFNPAIMKNFGGNREYILSEDIKSRIGVKDSESLKITFVKARQEYTFSDGNGGELILRTLFSTDEGVAFLIKYAGKTVYHAGDLNLWIWEDNEAQYDRWMRETYSAEIGKLKGEKIDLAFLPLDGRMGKRGFCGIEEFVKINRVEKICPIHLFTGFDFIDKFLNDSASIGCREKILRVDREDYKIEI